MSLLRLRGRCYNYGPATISLSRWRVFSVLLRWRTSSPSDRAPRRPGAPRRRCRAATFRASHSFLAGRVIDAAHREWRTVHEQPPAPDGDAAGECRHLCRQQRRRRWRRREGIGVTRTRRVAAPCSSRGYCPVRWGSSRQRARGARRHAQGACLPHAGREGLPVVLRVGGGAQCDLLCLSDHAARLHTGGGRGAEVRCPAVYMR